MHLRQGKPFTSSGIILLLIYDFFVFFHVLLKDIIWTLTHIIIAIETWLNCCSLRGAKLKLLGKSPMKISSGLLLGGGLEI
jgi:hypothetical protein